MKNLIIAVSLFFAICSSAQAVKKAPQKVKYQAGTAKWTPSSPEEGGLSNIISLEQFIPLKPEMKAMLQELFTTKYRMLSEVGDSAERKSIVSQAIAEKLQSTVDPQTFEKIKSNKALYTTLIN